MPSGKKVGLQCSEKYPEHLKGLNGEGKSASAKLSSKYPKILWNYQSILATVMVWEIKIHGSLEELKFMKSVALV